MTTGTLSLQPELDGSRYEFERSLGQGGAGAVHLVRDRETGEQLALKKLFRMDAKSVLRLKREFRSLAGINHPNIVKLYDLGRASDAWFLTMEYLDGTDLLSYVSRATTGRTVADGSGAAFAQAEAYREYLIPAFYQLACGIAALHRAGMLHRDLKPSNVLVSNHRVVVLDFGLVRELDGQAARVTDDGAVAGTPAYMAPEQALGRDLSEASDWYAFGAMLYEAISGELPHDGTLLQIMRGKLESDPLPLDSLVPNVPPRLSQLCMALLSRDPTRRPNGPEVLSVLEPTRPAAAAVPMLTLGESTHHTDTQLQAAAPPLFGRQTEIAQLWAAMSQAEDERAVVVHVRGESGAGKSALVEHFLHQLDSQASALGRSDVLLLRSRCYEREAMPFKALDGLMDALVRHFAGLDDFEVGHLLPAEVGLLTRLFPALERVHAVQRLLAGSKPQAEGIHDRKRAEHALRDLFNRLAARKPLVLWIDDLQWGDLDSASILQTWLREPSQSPILYVFSYRSDEVETSSCLRQLLQRDPKVELAQGAIEHTLNIAPLSSDDVQALCVQRLGSHASAHAELVQRIVQEAHGSPFLVSQLTALAEAKLARGDTLQTLSIDELVAQTGTLLPTEAKQVLAVLAVGGRPMPPKIVLRAAGVRRDGRAVVHALRGLNLVRTRDVNGERLLEVYHDRVREGVHAALNASQRQRIHEELLRALEFSGHSDPDWLHALALGAEQTALALRYGLTAAERAFATLAFQRAAELYRVCLDLEAPSSVTRGELWARLALALASCSLGVQAAAAYLEAAKLSSAQEAVAFTRSAASHLLRCGRFEEGEALVRSVLDSMGLELPQSDGGVVAAIVWERARIKLRGMGYKPRTEAELPASLLANIDVFDALHIETASYDPVRAALFQARSLRWALDAGEPKRVLRGLCSSANMAAVSGSLQAQREVDDLLGRAEALAQSLGHSEDRAPVVSSRAVCMFMLGRPREVLEPAYEAEGFYRANSRADAEGDYHRRFMVLAARIGALQAVGNHQRFLSELKAATEEARVADNRSAMLHLMLNQTVADEVQNCAHLSRPRLDEQRPQLPKDRFGTLHVLYVIAVLRAASATRDFAWGAAQVEELWPKYLRSPAHRSGFLALLAHSAHARFLLNRYVVEQGSGDPASLVRADLRALKRLQLPWTAGSTTRLVARATALQGRPERAIDLFRQSVEHFSKAQAADEIVRDRFALGSMLGGEEGARMCSESERTLASNGIVDPVADLRTFFPGIRSGTLSMVLAHIDADPVEVIGARYRVIEQLGRGGMAVVYRVWDPSRERELALKQLAAPEDAARGRELTQLFEREFYTLAQLSHPSVIEVYDYGLDVGGPYYCMELLDGGDVGNLAPLPYATACALMMQVCSSLSLLHSRRLVHRDISPRNVRCMQSGGAKLIDFGAMANMGACEQSVGTPAFIAPEVVHRLALDARTDLFSLGATLYFALTGRAPFAVRTFAELRDAWSCDPDAPSRIVPGIPAALDTLVLSLLRIDPNERPRSAFEVMHRLAAVVGVAHAEPEVVSQAYLSRPALIGREVEQRRFRQRVQRVLQGRGGGLIVESPAGFGRSRLLESYVLEAKTLGATVLQVHGRAAEPTAFGGALRLAQQLLDALPDAAARCAREAQAGALLFDPDQPAAAKPALLPPSRMSADRAQLQAALTLWLRSVCKLHPLLVAVDDVDLLDEASQAWLAALTHGAADCRLLILTTMVSSAAETAAPALNVLRSHSLSVPLGPLSLAQTEALFGSVFGTVPHVALVSDRIYQLAAGNPRESLALAQYLFDRQLLRYADGNWILPSELSVADLPVNAQQAFQERIAKLDPGARELAASHALATSAVFNRAAYAELAPALSGDQLEEALANLVQKGILQREAEQYTLAHHGFRSALATQLSAQESERIHTLLAEQCARARRPGLAEVHHLLLANQPARALPRLGQLLDELSDQVDFSENSGMEPRDICRTLERAHAAAASSGRPTREIFELARRLTSISLITDNTSFHRYAPAWCARLELDSGLVDFATTGDLGQALQRATARFAATAEHERVYRPDEAIKYVARYVTVAIVIGQRTRDIALLDTLPRLMEPLAQLSPVMHALWQNAVAATEMHYKARSDHARQRLFGVYDRLGQTAGAELRYVDSIRTAVAQALAAVEIGLGLPSATQWLEIMDREPAQRVNAMYLRRLLAVYEGDPEAAERYRKQAELLALQTSTRQLFGVPLYQELTAQVLARDLAGIKHAADRIQQLAARESGWIPMHHLAQGWFQRQRGDYQAALDAFERCLALTTPGRGVQPVCLNSWVSATAGCIAVLVELDQAERARLRGVLALERCALNGIDAWSHAISRELALAEAKLGDYAGAAVRLEACIAKLEGTSAAFLSAYYEARVHVAIWAKDAAATTRFIELASHANRFALRQTQLRDEARLAGLELELPPSAFVSSILGTQRSASSSALRRQVAAALDAATAPDERAARALALLSEASGASAGQLYMAQGQTLTCAASIGCANDAALHTFANGYWLQQLDDSLLTAGFSQLNRGVELLDGGAWTHPSGFTYRLLLLTAQHGGRLAFVGLAALSVQAANPLTTSVCQLAGVVCERLLELGDVEGVFPRDLAFGIAHIV